MQAQALLEIRQNSGCFSFLFFFFFFDPYSNDMVLDSFFVCVCVYLNFILFLNFT